VLVVSVTVVNGTDRQDAKKYRSYTVLDAIQILALYPAPKPHTYYLAGAALMIKVQSAMSVAGKTLQYSEQHSALVHPLAYVAISP
jgi:hypothetical protein